MNMMKSVTLGSALMLLMSLSVTSAWAEDGHDRGDRGHGFYSQIHDGGEFQGGFMAQNRDRGERQNVERRNFGERRNVERRNFGQQGFGGIRRGGDRGRRPGYIMDRRYHHDRYYPPRGFFQRELPRGYMTFRHDDDRYFYRGGIWYRHSGLGFIVVMPPFGMVVPILPPYYTTVWVGGIPYYYANGIYYVWQPAQEGYVVTQPPSASNVVTQPQDPEQFYVYPKRGQSKEQQDKDRYECHRWAVGQTGFDPSQSVGNLTDSQLTAKRADYRRAIEACLDARGYSVK